MQGVISSKSLCVNGNKLDVSPGTCLMKLSVVWTHFQTSGEGPSELFVLVSHLRGLIESTPHTRPTNCDTINQQEHLVKVIFKEEECSREGLLQMSGKTGVGCQQKKIKKFNQGFFL